jgi:hypothetical protein
MDSVPAGLFESVRYYFGSNEDRQIRNLLKQGGAKREFSLNERVTHIIASSGYSVPPSIYDDGILRAAAVKVKQYL